MKLKLYPVKIFLLLFTISLLWQQGLKAQSCPGLQINYTANESRCMATGSIVVTATGGSGNYNYKVTGPVTTPYTSSNVITGLQPGTYTVIVKDVTADCEAQQTGAVVTGSYSDPRFQLTKTDVSCVGNDGTISRSSLQYGLAPFTYTIIAPSPAQVGNTNSTGDFSNLAAGEYFIQLQDSCGGQQVRRITIENFSWWFDGVNVTRVGCDSADAAINLRDSKGNMNTSGTAFSGYRYGVVQAPGDTAWFITNAFRFFLNKRRSVVIVVKDNCGNMHDAVWNLPANQMPVVSGSVAITNAACSTFTAIITGQGNLANPQYCLYTDANALVSCNSTGVFNNVSYGNYCIKVRDVCYDTLITRCFSVSHPTPALGNNVNTTNRTCTTFTATVTGLVNLTNPEYCIYNAANVQLSCNMIGEFNNLPYGTYTIKTKDGCVDTTIVRTFTVTRLVPSISGSSISNKTCTTFDVTVTGQSNLISPTYCLYDSLGNVVTCNSTGVFTDVPHGSYCIKAISCTDTTAAVCFVSRPPTPAITAPLQFGNLSCSTFTVTVAGQTNLVNPQYCLRDTVHHTTVCNTTGVFDSIPYGNYCIDIKDGCLDTTIVRCFSMGRPTPVLGGNVISNKTCSTFDVAITGSTNLTSPTYCLYKPDGTVDTCNTTGIFTGLPYGSYCIRAVTACGDSTNSICFSSAAPLASVSATVSISNKACATFTATITGQTNLTSPQYCLYNAANVQVNCNSTGVFDSIPYGSYCIKIHDGCLDTTITRCFTQAQAIPSVNATMQQFNNNCTTFTARVTGSNLTNAQYTLYDSANVVVQSNIYGIFDNLPYGRYCVAIHDGCVDTTMRICQTFANPKAISITTSKSCTVGSANVQVQFQNNSNGPFTINVYKPDGTSAYSGSTASSTSTIILPALPAGQQYKVVGTDLCGYKDSALVIPDATIITKSITTNGKCPSATWQNGSGDLSVTCSSNSYPVYPYIIKKNGATYNRSYSSNTGNNYIFSDLEPATYIVEYTLQTCNTKVYDTFALQPYVFPTQDRSAIYQCDNNSFSLGASVQGGVGPFTYEIIGSTPSSPSINAQQFNNPVFAINNGTKYSLIRLRAIDACGNATLNDVSVLPLQNIIIKATSTCMYKNVVLSVDSIPNASYHWYKQRTATDSVAVGDSMNFTIPFLMPEQTGTYICKVTVNNDCITRLAYFDLTGDCNYQFLPVNVTLSGRTEQNKNVLRWTAKDEQSVLQYRIERKTTSDQDYAAVGQIKAKHNSNTVNYSFTDAQVDTGAVSYRIKIVGDHNTTKYSNVIIMKPNSGATTVYPNPVLDGWNLSFSANSTTNYVVELTNMAGQVLYRKELKSVTDGTYHFQRNSSMQKGLYLLKVRNSATGKTDVYKLLFN